MSGIHFLSRFSRIRNTLFNVPLLRATPKLQLSSSSDDETKVQRKLKDKKKSEDALDKLNKLLKTMIEDDVTSSKTKLDLAKPVFRRRKEAKEEKKPKSAKIEPKNKDIISAVKDVAESLGSDVKQTESELLMKLLNDTPSDKSSDLNDLFKGMKVDHDNSQSKAQQVRKILQARTDENVSTFKRRTWTSKPVKTDLIPEKIDLFGSEPLGIFTDKETEITEGQENKTWNHLYERDMRLAVTHPPGNYFQQMILWTEQGKVWKFPIDNEQGLEDESKIYFTEHVFLEKHLEPWCPPKGPLRHFMELVCVGLSKNPYLTVEAKKEHLEWFKNYFENKKQLLKETGVIKDAGLGGKQDSPRQIEQ